jgi:hypothetical protein
VGKGDAGEVRFIVQAVNGVGLVTAATNFGEYFALGAIDPPDNRFPSQLTVGLESLGAALRYGGYARPFVGDEVQDGLTCNGDPLGDEPVVFSLGSVSVQATTGSRGLADAEIPLVNLPGEYKLTASFAGNESCAPASDSLDVEIFKAQTDLYLQSPEDAPPVDAPYALMATLTDQNFGPAQGSPNRLAQKTVIFVVRVLGEVPGPIVHVSSAVTDYAGRAYLRNHALSAGDYYVTAYFGGEIPVGPDPQNPQEERTIVLDDPVYEPAEASTTISLSSDPYIRPQAFDDDYPEYVVEVGEFLADVPCVFANDLPGDYAIVESTIVAGPGYGQASLNVWGCFVYQNGTMPPEDGIDTFRYRIVDAYGFWSEATVFIEILAP